MGDDSPDGEMQTIFRAGLFPLFLAVTATGGCNGVLGGVDVSIVAWEGELISSTSAPSGRAAALSQSGRTDASIQISGGPDDDGLYSWRIRTGSCASPGSLIGGLAQYPDLALEGGGSVSANAVLTDGMPAGRNYHVVLIRGADDAEVACGQLQRV